MHWSSEVIGHALALSSPLAACYAARLLSGLAGRINESGYVAHPNSSPRTHDNSKVAVAPATSEKSEDDIFQYQNAVFCKKGAPKRTSDGTGCDDDDTDFCIMTPQQALGALGDHATKFTKIFLNGVTFVSDASEGTVLSVDEYLNRVQPALSRPRSSASSSEPRGSCRSPASRYKHHVVAHPYGSYSNGVASPVAVSCCSMQFSSSSMAISDTSAHVSTPRNSFESAFQSASSSPAYDSQDSLFAAGISTEGSCCFTTPQVQSRGGCSPRLAGDASYEQMMRDDRYQPALCAHRAVFPSSMPASEGGVPSLAPDYSCYGDEHDEARLQHHDDVAAMLAVKDDICSVVHNDEDGGADSRALLAADSVFACYDSLSNGDELQPHSRPQSPCRSGHHHLRDCERQKCQWVPAGVRAAPAVPSVQLRRTNPVLTPAHNSEPPLQETATFLAQAQSASARVRTARPSVSGLMDASTGTSAARKRGVCPGAIPRRNTASLGGVNTVTSPTPAPTGLSRAPALPLPDGCTLESSVPPALRYYLAQARAAGSHEGSQSGGSCASSGVDACEERAACQTAERRSSTDYESSYQPGFVRATVEQLNTQRLVCCHVTPSAVAKTSSKPKPLAVPRVAAAK